MEHDFLFGLWTLALVTVCFAIGFTVKNQMRALHLQAEMLKCLGDLTGAFLQVQSHNAMRATQRWRDLPPDSRLMLRNSLIDVLREMDEELPARN